MLQKFQPVLERNLQKFKAKFKQEALRGNRCPISDTGQAKSDGSRGDVKQWCSVYL